MVLIAYFTERFERKRSGNRERILTTRKIALIGVFSAIAAVLHMLDFPIPFAPSFYKMDFSEIPALIGAFAFGPVAAVMIEFCKIVLKLLFKGTSTRLCGRSGGTSSSAAAFCFPRPSFISSAKRRKTQSSAAWREPLS